MNRCYRLGRDSSTHAQTDSDHSFLGGMPRLPASEPVPVCRLCGAEQAFFFQVGFPSDTAWAERSLAVFSCVDCASDDYLIPEMLNDPLRGVEIPEGFLDEYQRNFRFLVFPTHEALLRKEYAEKVRFSRFILEPSEDPAIGGNKIGGVPAWLVEDEAPGSYAGRHSLTFLLQLEGNFAFPILYSAPRQMEIALDGNPAPAPHLHYELFIGNALYLFGVEDYSRSLVYAITQVE